MSDKNKHAPKERFSRTVEYYVKYRPGYPCEVLKILLEKCGLHAGSVIADIGSGTGIFTRLLLDNGNQVFAVEPNREMREAAEHYLSEYKNFVSVDAASEATTLPNASIDIITAAQAFHWFDQEKVKKEFLRILKPQGYLVLLWNLRSNTSKMMHAYEALLQKFGTDYKAVCAEGVSEKSIREFYSPSTVEIIVLPNQQVFDWEGFQGRLLSCSYVPKQGEPHFNEMLDEAKLIFDKYQENGKVTLLYDTKVYLGQIT